MVLVANPEAGQLWCWWPTRRPTGGGGERLRRRAAGGNEVVVAVADAVVVAEAKCGVRGRSGPDSGALKRMETRRGCPGG